MRNSTILGLLILMLFTPSCSTKYSKHEKILEAEKILFENPESAYQILLLLNQSEKLSTVDYAAWCLHFTHALYKTDRDIESDSLIRVAIDYYGDSRLDKYSGTAYYLQGCIAEMRKDPQKAMLAYEKAICKLQQTDEMDLLGLAVINKGYIYQLNEVYQEAYEYFVSALEIFRQTGNKSYQTSALLEISDLMLQLDYPFDSIISYSNQALALAKETDNKSLYYWILSRQGELYSNIDDRKSTNYLLTAYANYPVLKNRNASFLSYTYSRLGMTDSAMYYLRQTEKLNQPTETALFTDLAKAKVYSNLGNYNLAYQYMNEAYTKQDSVFKNKLKRQLYRIDKQFDISEKEKENALLKLSNRNKVIVIAVLVIGVLVILLILLLIINRNKTKQTEHQIYQQKMEFELQSKQMEIENKIELLVSKLKQKIDITLQFRRLEQSKSLNADPKLLVLLFTDQVILNETEWPYYIQETDTLFGGKLTALQNRFSDLTMADMIVIVLICLNIEVSDACRLLNNSKNTMYMRRKRIKKRLNIEADKDLVEWLKLYFGN